MSRAKILITTICATAWLPALHCQAGGAEEMPDEVSFFSGTGIGGARIADDGF